MVLASGFWLRGLGLGALASGWWIGHSLGPMKTVLTGDLGGTKCRFAVLAEDLSVHAVRRVPTPRNRELFRRMLDEDVAAVLAADLPDGWEPPAAIGIGAAGVITEDCRSIVYAPNLHLDGVDVAALMEASHGLPATVMNDGRASALGEFRHGFAAGLQPLLVLFCGTGIGIGSAERNRIVAIPDVSFR